MLKFLAYAIMSGLQRSSHKEVNGKVIAIGTYMLLVYALMLSYIFILTDAKVTDVIPLHARLYVYTVVLHALVMLLKVNTL